MSGYRADYCLAAIQPKAIFGPIESCERCKNVTEKGTYEKDEKEGQKGTEKGTDLFIRHVPS